MDQRSLERIRKRKRDDDDELFFFILPALYLYLKNTEKIKRHSSITYGRRKVRRHLHSHLKDCLATFRMEPEIFRWIESYLRTEGLISDSDTIKVEAKLAFFLYMLSHNASYEDLQVAFQHSASTFHDYLNEFFDIVPILASRFLRPRHIDGPHSRIANDDRFFPYFENCLGAIDGSHVPVTRSPQLQDPWRNRKGSLSQIVMFTCDFDLNVTFISCGWEGSATASRVLSSALLNGFNVPTGKFYLVDGGYANTQHFLAPYRGVKYHLKEWDHGYHAPQNYMDLFNHRHAVARNHIERLIGILKKRFSILNVGTFHSIKNQVKTPAAASVLHNKIKLQDGDEEWLEDQEDNIDPAVFVDLPNGDGENIQENHLHENHVLGNQLRDHIAFQMWNDYIA